MMLWHLERNTFSFQQRTHFLSLPVMPESIRERAAGFACLGSASGAAFARGSTVEKQRIRSPQFGRFCFTSRRHRYTRPGLQTSFVHAVLSMHKSHHYPPSVRAEITQHAPEDLLPFPRDLYCAADVVQSTGRSGKRYISS